MAKKKKTKQRQVERLARIIKHQVEWFSGWHVTEISMRRSCLKAAKNILRALKAG
jgi:hypothetical protein